MNTHLFVSLHSLLELDQLPQKRREFKGVLSQKTEDAFGITYKFVVVCLCILTAQGTILKEIRTFTTMMQDLLRMLEWLKQAGCSHAALESTGVYWKPIHNLLETELEVLLINAQHIKAIPGRKTDVKLRHEVA